MAGFETGRLDIFCKIILDPNVGINNSNLDWYVCMCIIGSRRLMPPDTLQPKAYCTNPGH